MTDLSAAERLAYRRGYDRGVQAYNKANGYPSLTGPAPAAGTPERKALGVRLAREGAAYRAAREPSCDAAGMRAVAAWRKKAGLDKAPVRRRRVVSCPNCGAEVAA